MCDLYFYILNFIFFCFLTTTVLITPCLKSLHFIFFDWLLEPNFGAGRCALASGERGGGVGLDRPQGTLARPSFACWRIRRRLVAAMSGREDLSIRGFFLRGNLYFSARQKGGLLLRAGRGHHSGFEVGHHLCWRHISSTRVVVPCVIQFSKSHSLVVLFLLCLLFRVLFLSFNSFGLRFNGSWLLNRLSHDCLLNGLLNCFLDSLQLSILLNFLGGFLDFLSDILSSFLHSVLIALILNSLFSFISSCLGCFDDLLVFVLLRLFLLRLLCLILKLSCLDKVYFFGAFLSEGL